MTCLNHYCWITGKNTGVGTNAGCSCLRPLPIKDRLALQKRIQELENRIKELATYQEVKK